MDKKAMTRELVRNYLQVVVIVRQRVRDKLMFQEEADKILLGLQRQIEVILK